MIRRTLKEIAELIDGEVVGDESTVITGASGIKEASRGDITFLANPKYFALIDKTQASAIITSFEVSSSAKPLVRTTNPSLAFTKILAEFFPYETPHPKGIHPTAVVGKAVELGKNVALGPYVVVEDHAAIGDGTIIYAACYIGQHATIGSNSLLYPHVSIRERVSIGKNVIIHSGTVIGSDGFGFVTINGAHHKIPQVGVVEVKDDVEIGANVTIDRARFDKTVIGKGTKIDNLVHLAHNVVVGENSIIVAQAGISGSTVIGNGVTIAGQAGLVGHITIGDGAVLAAQAGVTKSVAPNTTVSGYPARQHDQAKRVNACVQSLPKLYKVVDELKKKIAELESKLK